MAWTITIAPFNRTFQCEDEETILDAGLRNGINLRHGCKHGGCGSCKARIAAGEVENGEASSFALMDFEREEGYCLLCSSTPLTDVTIEAEDYTEEELFGPPA